MKKTDKNIIIISDGTGETASAIVRATLVQYEEDGVISTRVYPHVRTEAQLRSILESVDPKNTMIAYTVVLKDLRKVLHKESKKYCLIDLLNPLLEVFNRQLTEKPVVSAGILHQVDKDYFKRIDAVEFSLKYDDGAMTQDLQEADIVLVGVSRTSKTPLSIFLSYKGYKVANIPFIKDIKLPEEVFSLDQKKIIALTIDEEVLLRIRKNRLQKIGMQSRGGDYADKLYVYHELEQAKQCFSKYRWPVINVTDRALEETAADILRIIRLRTDQK